MQISTNKIGLLLARIDSGGALRRAGDRVLVEASERQETWTARQYATHYQKLVATLVHEQGGIVALTQGEQMECHLPDAFAALRAATYIKTQRGKEIRGTPAAEAQVHLAIGYGSMLVENGLVSGQALDDLRALVRKSDGRAILASGPLVARLPAIRTIQAKLFAKTPQSPEEASFEIEWQPRLRLEIKGRSIEVSAERASAKLSTDGTESARIWLADGRFYVDSSVTGMTSIERRDRHEQLYHGSCELTEEGKLGLNATTGLSDAMEIANFSIT
ncbi:MAG: hypothetical protein K0U93_29730 [Gammaproteobacteria bacterium]|nr:hypothetical protein [Gammaproteobacteria bacterium]